MVLHGSVLEKNLPTVGFYIELLTVAFIPQQFADDEIVYKKLQNDVLLSSIYTYI